jgi:hypothetical protein
MPISSIKADTARKRAEPEPAAQIYKDGKYLANNQTWHAEDSAWKADQISRIIDKNGIACETICEVGCGAGEILRQLSLKYPSTRFIGYEISPQAFELCKSRESARLKFLQKDILREKAAHDCLLCVDVFEHVEDYMGFVRSLRSKAAYKIFHIPLSLSVHSVISSRKLTGERDRWGHLHYFNRETALATLKDCGYEILDTAYTPHFRDLPAESLVGSLARTPLKLFYGLSPDLFVRLLGGCSLLVLAR